MGRCLVDAPASLKTYTTCRYRLSKHETGHWNPPWSVVVELHSVTSFRLRLADHSLRQWQLTDMRGRGFATRVVRCVTPSIYWWRWTLICCLIPLDMLLVAFSELLVHRYVLTPLTSRHTTSLQGPEKWVLTTGCCDLLLNINSAGNLHFYVGRYETKKLSNGV